MRLLLLLQLGLCYGATLRVSVVEDHSGHPVVSAERIAPGKYVVIATDSVVDYSADCVEKLWALRNKIDPVELAASGSLSLTLELTGLR
ncbi:MAG TPA: hypothetical protein VKT81_00560 [Bryobacteraceae bacterium]|nr:hypothetical protein [Bryobacteraceae bacterium]